jgi:hypothetical protein
VINIKVETGDKDTRTGSGNAYFIASHNHNGLSSEEFFCYDTGETTQEVVAAIDDPCCRKHHGERILAQGGCCARFARIEGILRRIYVENITASPESK